MRNYGNENPGILDRMINRALLIVITACLAYFALGRIMPRANQPSTLSIAPVENITSISLVDYDGNESWAVWRPRNIAVLAETLALGEGSVKKLNKTEYSLRYSVYIHAYPTDKNALTQLELYTKDADGGQLFYAAAPKSEKLYAFSGEEIEAFFSTIDMDRAEFLPNNNEALAAVCAYADGDELKSAILADPSGLLAIFDVKGAFYDRSYEDTEWLMSMDFACENGLFGLNYKPYFILKGISGQYYLADEQIMFEISENIYNRALLHLGKLDFAIGYPMADTGDLTSLIALDATEATITNPKDFSSISAILHKVSLPAYGQEPSKHTTVLNIYSRLMPDELRALENVGLLNYTITRSEEGEYFIGSNFSYYYPCFRISEKDVDAIVKIVQKVAGQQ